MTNEILPAFTVKATPKGRNTVLDLLTVFYKNEAVGRMLVDLDLTWATERMRQLEMSGHHITITAILLKAIAIAQVNHESSRTIHVAGGRQAILYEINAGFTVEKIVDGEPIVFFGEIEKPHEKSIEEIAEELKRYHDSDVKDLQILAQQNFFALLPHPVRLCILWLGSTWPAFRLRYSRATFGFSSLGSLGVNAVFGPAICTAVFGIGAVEDRVCVRDKKLAIRPMVSISLNFDQRLMSASQASQLLNALKSVLETGWCQADSATQKEFSLAD